MGRDWENRGLRVVGAESRGLLIPVGRMPAPIPAPSDCSDRWKRHPECNGFSGRRVSSFRAAHSPVLQVHLHQPFLRQILQVAAGADPGNAELFCRFGG